jgi:hypothetical protein
MEAAGARQSVHVDGNSPEDTHTTKLFKSSAFIDGCSCSYSNNDVGVTSVCAHTSHTYQQRSAHTNLIVHIAVFRASAIVSASPI